LQEAIQEARAARVKSEPLKVERDVYAHRAAIALGQYASVIDGVRDDEPVPLQAVKLLASYLSSPPKGREVALLQLEDWLADAGAAANPTLQFVAGTIYLHQGDLAAALTAVKGGGAHLETCVAAVAGVVGGEPVAGASRHAPPLGRTLASPLWHPHRPPPSTPPSTLPWLCSLGLVVQVYLRMDRADLAEKAVKAMAAQDDESALTQLCTGLTCLAQVRATIRRQAAGRKGGRVGAEAAARALRRLPHRDSALSARTTHRTPASSLPPPSLCRAATRPRRRR
jgi:hypothetical protein